MRRFAVIGLGRFGMTMAEALAQGGADVVAIDADADLVEAVKERVSAAMRLDATNEAALAEAGIKNVDVAVIAIGDSFESVQLTMIALENLGVPHVVARANGPVQQKILERLGAHEVIDPERAAARTMAARLLRPGLVDQLEGEGSVQLVQAPVPDSLAGRTVGESRLREEYGVNIVAIVRPPSEADSEGLPTYVVPGPDHLLAPGDEVLLFGPRESLERLLGR